MKNQSVFQMTKTADLSVSYFFWQYYNVKLFLLGYLPGLSFETQMLYPLTL